MKLVELLDPPYSTIINWALIILVIVTMVFAGLEAHNTSQLIEERGCVSIKNQTGITIETFNNTGGNSYVGVDGVNTSTIASEPPR